VSVHQLKTWPEPFQALVDGSKVHEIRRADRDFKEGDVLLLREWDQSADMYSGRVAVARVGHISTPGSWGLPADLCVMSLPSVASFDTVSEAAAFARDLQASRRTAMTTATAAIRHAPHCHAAPPTPDRPDGGCFCGAWKAYAP
jgi:hypothetical protein